LNEIRGLRQFSGPNDIDTENLIVSKSSLRIAKVSIAIGAVVGAIGIVLVIVQLNTNSKIEGFDTLLKKQDAILSKDSTLISLSGIQIDSIGSLLRKMSKISTVMVDEYNDGAQDRNRLYAKNLLDRSNSFNQVASMGNNMEPIINVFRQGRNNRLSLSFFNVNNRVKILDTMRKEINNASTGISELTWMSGGDTVLSNLLNDIGEYKNKCLFNFQSGVTGDDTSYIGNKMFADIIYAFFDFEDSLTAHVGQNRDRIIKNLRDIERCILINDKRIKQK
jgi:hypothetical protein